MSTAQVSSATDEPDPIRNRLFLGQVRNFKGMRFPGGISPTDLDAFFEIRDRVFIFIELKHNGSPLPKGQRLAFERLVDAVSLSRKAILIVGSHHSAPPSEIMVVDCIVTQFYECGRWHDTPYPGCTVMTLSEMFMELAFQEEKT